MVQKAVEMGASALQPVLTRHTQVSRVNVERMRANVIEAAEQCGILSLAEVAEPVALDRFLEKREASRLLVFCDEAADIGNPIEALQQGLSATEGIDVLIGPEGGFAEEERALLLRQPRTLRLSLGPRILRADTAGVAALALVQAALGDWRGRASQPEGYPLSHRPLIQLANPCRNAAPAMLRPAPTRPPEPRGPQTNLGTRFFRIFGR